jgi:GNAT superfamily N-acetyltransferase
VSDAAWERRRDDGHVVSTDRARMDLDRVHRWIAEQYWSPGIARDVFVRSLERALGFGLFAPDGEQIGFARVLSDYARVAWLSDVVVDARRRGAGLGAFLVESVLQYPPLAGIGRWGLNTRDSHSLYARFGFEVAPPGRFMLRGPPV